ncbi:MAG TPA: GNVR domain-containing protein, partial [Rhodocyclaceae bacterium]|nr:GNVR domain-containing protein [Rhodocyclaceae bacterium]
AFEILKKEAERARQDLQEVAERRVRFLQENKLVFDLQKETQEVKNLVELEGSLANTRIKVASLQASLVDVDKQLAHEPPTQRISVVKEQNVLRESTRLKKLELQNQLALTLNRYREDSPEALELKESMGRLDTIIEETPEIVEKSATEGLNSVHQQLLTSRSTLRSELEGHNASVRAMEAIGKEMRDRLSLVPDVQNRLKQLDNAYGTAQEKYQALLVKLSQVDVNLATAKATPPSLRIVDYAVPPSSRWWPRLKILYPVALLAGLLLGVAAAQIKRLAGGRVRRNTWGRRTGDALIYGQIVVATYGHPFKVVLPGEAESPGEPGAAS